MTRVLTTMLAGAALIGGPGATLGGAALGGLVGNVTTR